MSIVNIVMVLIVASIALGIGVGMMLKRFARPVTDESK